MPEVVAWDSCIIIDAIQRTNGVYEYLEPVIRKAESGELYIVISTVSIAEVKYCRELTAHGFTQDQQSVLIDRWLNSDYVVKRNADNGICSYAARLGRELGKRSENLTPIDSIILATALKNGVDALVTIDGGAARESNIGLLELDRQFGNPPLWITQPQDLIKQPGLDLPAPDE